jgi:formylmethanofuran dehydrogenase subunit E
MNSFRLKKKEHLAKCSKCGEIFDRRSVRAVLVAGMAEQYLVQAILGAAQFG